MCYSDNDLVDLSRKSVAERGDCLLSKTNAQFLEMVSKKPMAPLEIWRGNP